MSYAPSAGCPAATGYDLPYVRTNDSEVARTTAGVVIFDEPTSADGARLWEIARDSRVLDVNSSYAYLLWCRDFAATSVVARVDGRVVGFVTGYRRPDQPDVIMVWQVAVDAEHRGRSLASRMLGALVDRLVPAGVSALETTISPDNAASIALFGSLARDRGATMDRVPLFAAADFPAADGPGHEPEDLYVVAPLR